MPGKAPSIEWALAFDCVEERTRAGAAQVLIVHGEGDALVPAANSRRLAAILPGATLQLLPRCGHNPQARRSCLDRAQPH